MIRNRLIIVGLLLTASVFSQESSAVATHKGPKPDSTGVYRYVPSMSEYPGGWSAESAYIRTHLIVPESAKTNHINGRVIVRFVVETNGNAARCKLTRRIPACPECDSAAMRVVRTMHGYIPAKLEGQPVPVYHEVNVFFGNAEAEFEKRNNPPPVETPKEDWSMASPPMPVEDPNQPVSKVDVPPSFPGGEQALNTYIEKNLQYPAMASKAKIEGVVFAKVVVAGDGTVRYLYTTQTIADCQECTTEAIRFIKAMPKWTPAELSGKNVGTYYDLSIPFHLPKKGKKK